jgi:hypothetical protein
MASLFSVADATAQAQRIIAAFIHDGEYELRDLAYLMMPHTRNWRGAFLSLAMLDAMVGGTYAKQYDGVPSDYETAIVMLTRLCEQLDLYFSL